MKKVALLILLVCVAAGTVAAVPPAIQAKCWNPYTGKWVPCKSIGVYINQGEPTMEKVSYFKFVYSTRSPWNTACNSSGYWYSGTYHTYYCVGTYKLPVGCQFRYQY